MRRGLCLLMLLVGLGCLGCSFGGEDEAGSVAGPGITVHCDNLEPGNVGPTAVKVACPGATP